jgi:hypothetical protein
MKNLIIQGSLYVVVGISANLDNKTWLLSSVVLHAQIFIQTDLLLNAFKFSSSRSITLQGHHQVGPALTSSIWFTQFSSPQATPSFV